MRIVATNWQLVQEPGASRDRGFSVGHADEQFRLADLIAEQCSNIVMLIVQNH